MAIVQEKEGGGDVSFHQARLRPATLSQQCEG